MATHKFSLFLAIVACWLATSLTFGTSSAHAQTSPAQTSSAVQYQAAVLRDDVPEIDLAGKSYLISEDKTPFTLQDILIMVKNGDIVPYLATADTIHIGLGKHGTWLILPIKNNSSKELWDVDLGSVATGRFGSFKEIIVYNMSRNKFLINTQNARDSLQNISSPLALQIAQNDTNFYILYLKPNAGIPTIISPTLKEHNSAGLWDYFIKWLCPILGIGAALYFLKYAIDRLSIVALLQSFIWAIFATPLIFNTAFLYVGSYDLELLFPTSWVLLSTASIVGLIRTQHSSSVFPSSVAWGLGCASFITGLVGIILLKMLLGPAMILIYGASFFLLALTSSVFWLSRLRESDHDSMFLAYTSVIFLVLLGFMGILATDLVPLHVLTPLIPQLFIYVAIFLSVAGTVSGSSASPTVAQETPGRDVFSENQLNSAESTLIHEAKEQSEHHRLMQVIEQERKLMSDLQVKSAQQTEEMRKAKDAADEANRAKSAFLAVVSHEIRTPMTGIMGMLRLLQETQLTKDQKEYASTIKDSGDAMLALLNDILDFEKIESGKMDLEHINFDLKRLIRSVYTLMRGHAEAKNIELVLEADPNTPNWVYGDPTRLRQVLLNLINNAIKFTSKGAVYLRIRDLTGESDNLNSNIKSHQIYFAVQDSGIGIGAANQKKLFMPFAQADSSISRKYGGTGLGLAICKRLIEAMGGAISISSKEGEGSTFFFTISMEEGTEIADDSSDSTAFGKDSSMATNAALPYSVSVLVVDDNGINQKVVSGFAEKLGAKTYTASTGADALDMVARHQFDLILMDLGLPDMNGVEVTKIIRGLSIPGKANTPIIALTGNAGDDDKQTCLDAGMNDYATKPITFEKISELLNKVVQNHYGVKSATDVIDFSDTSSHDPEPVQDSTQAPVSPASNMYTNISPLAAYSSRINNDMSPAPQPDTPFAYNADLDEEEDSFSLAVKQFEALEQQMPAMPPPASSQSSPLQDTDSISDHDLSKAGLDADILESLRGGLSNDQIKEILVSFYEKADELIAEIGTTYLTGNAIALNARAHELKGMAGNFGFSEISAMCAAIEKAAKDNDLGPAKDPIQHLGEKYSISRSYLNKWLDS